MLWVYDYKLLIPSLIQRTINQMLKGKSCLDFNELNSFHNKSTLIARSSRLACETIVSISCSRAQ